jgi:hypothetical protein
MGCISFYLPNFAISFKIDTREFVAPLHNGNLQYAVFNRQGDDVCSYMKAGRPLS